MSQIRSQILFKPFPSAELSESGLIIPENARPISNKGTIVKVDMRAENNPKGLKAGMIAYRVKSWGDGVMIDNELHFLMDASAILATE